MSLDELVLKQFPQAPGEVIDTASSLVDEAWNAVVEAYNLAHSESSSIADLQRAAALLDRAYNDVRRAQEAIARYVSTDSRAAALYVKLSKISYVAQLAAQRLQSVAQRLQQPAAPAAQAPVPPPAQA